MGFRKIIRRTPMAPPPGAQLPLALDTPNHDVRDHPFHFYTEDWDDRAIEARIDLLLRTGTVPPSWNYPTPRPYNGASGDMRVLGWQKIQIACRKGILSWPKKCSVCGSTKALQYHNENYFRPLNARPICQACHRTLHRRFRYPSPWMALVYANKFDGAWFARIALTELTTEQALTLAALPDPMDARVLT